MQIMSIYYKKYLLNFTILWYTLLVTYKTANNK